MIQPKIRSSYPTKESLLADIGQESIMLRYLNMPSIPKSRFHSPFYEDSNADCELYYNNRGVLVFKDYGTYDYGDCFWVAMKVTNLPFNEVLKHIKDDFKLQKVEYVKTVNIKPLPKSPCNIDVNVRPFTNYDLEYWNRFGINTKTLNMYNVQSCKRTTISNNDYQYTLSSSEKDPTFSYTLGEGIYKIYKPLNSRYKWRNNYNKTKEEIIEGYNQLTWCGPLVITKALKEVMFLRQHLNINAIAAASETKLISEASMIDYFSAFDNIYLLMDNDEAGREAASKYLEAYPNLINLVVEPYKNITDYAESESIDKAIQYTKQLLNLNI